MTAHATRRPPLAPLAALVGAVAIALATQLGALLPAGDPLGLEEPLLDVVPAEDGDVGDPSAFEPIDPFAPIEPFDPAAELAGVREDVAFWAARVEADARDIVAAVKLAEADLAEARLTGDATAYLRAQDAVDLALATQPAYEPALALRATVLVSLHRFPEARDTARAILATTPDDPTALGVVGDASLELGDLATAGAAYQHLGLIGGGAAAEVRASRLAFVRGAPASAVNGARAAVAAAADDGLEGGELAFYHVTLGELLVATGDAHGARDAFEAALAARPQLPSALAGIARLDAYEGDLDAAIAGLDAAIAAIPLPEWLARRADLLDLRARAGDAALADGDAALAAGDAALAEADRATVEAIAGLAGDASRVYDRGLSLYLSDHGLDPDRAVRLAAAELEVRRDLYGFDAFAWALFNAGRPAEAEEPMAAALAEGTRDARLWYHAGLIAAANGRSDEARAFLADALGLGPALDPVSRARAEAALELLR
ncbi:MAG: tetratricopeptide repeat protein [Chloroflexota bacterium]